MSLFYGKIEDYIFALNAHAIVAITDCHGVILEVNDKFCEISKYSREELCGKTHKIINSGFHPPQFFHDFWQTISQGKVWQGEVCNQAKDGSIYWVYSTIVPFLDDGGNPVKYIAIRADITKLKSVEREAKRLSRQDELTGLYNRRMFTKRFIEAQKHSALNKRYCALLSIDLDGFKGVNDHFGHGQGDILLCELSSRLTRLTRVTDTLARMGGDEFFIILSNLGDDPSLALQIASDIGQDLLKVMAEPYLLPNLKHGTIRLQDTVSISGSIGGRIFLGDSISMDDLLVEVDFALYHAKQNGKKQMVFYEAGQAQYDVMRKNTSLEFSLRLAIEKNEFCLHYQPIVDPQGNICGMEALLRWNSREHGLVPPDLFIPLAERAGLIGMIGTWVLETGCRQLAEWRNDREKMQWTLSINVSALQLNALTFFDDLLALIETTKAPATKLILEVTENIFMRSAEKYLQNGINLLRDKGIGIAIDDFGTGYSSLSYLINLPITRIKIDRSFIKEISQSKKIQGIVLAILTLAKALDLQVVAEGVETQEQYSFLLSAHCDLFQGYFFGKPQSLMMYS